MKIIQLANEKSTTYRLGILNDTRGAHTTSMVPKSISFQSTHSSVARQTYFLVTLELEPDKNNLRLSKPNGNAIQKSDRTYLLHSAHETSPDVIINLGA
jgi:hypothetical protein